MTTCNPCLTGRWSYLGSHCFRLQYSPDHPALHIQESPTQWPCSPQSRSHSSEITELMPLVLYLYWHQLGPSSKGRK